MGVRAPRPNAQAALCSPLDLVKARLAAAPETHPNSLAALWAIATSAEGGGANGLWRGGQATTLRAACGSAGQLATYDHVKRLVAQRLGAMSAAGASASPGVTWSTLTSLSGALPILCATLVSAASYVTAAAPADLIKTRLMVDGSTGKKYTGPVDCLRRSIREDGPGVLFCGWGASFARLLPVLMMVFPLLEALRSAFGVGSF